MPFIPLTTEEENKLRPCQSLQHYPPMNYLPTQPGKWICPMCGYKTLMNIQYITSNTLESEYKIICYTKLGQKMIRIV